MAKSGINSPEDYRHPRVSVPGDADDLFDARIPVCHKRGHKNGSWLLDLVQFI